MKKFCTYDEQFSLLVERGLSIANKETAIKILKSKGYYNLINGYSKFFENEKGDSYIKGTTFDQIVALYTFDQELRNTLYKFTSIIECQVKSIIGHEFSRKHGINDKDYLTEDCFTSNPSRKDQVQELIKKCKETIQEGSDKKSSHYKHYIHHYMVKYKQVPLWVLARALSFGSISKFYSLMLDEEKETIANEFGLTSPQFSNILKIIVQFRNIIAHGERAFCERTRETLCNVKIFTSLSLPKNPKGEIKCGRRDVLALLICCKYILEDSDFRNLTDELGYLIVNLKDQVSPFIMSRVLNEMGLKSIHPNVLIKVIK